MHAFNRGNRKMAIVLDEADRWRLAKIFRFFNDENFAQNVLRGISEEKHFMSVSDTDIKRKPIVKILSYCIRENHFHLLLKEIIEGGITKFMRKLGIGFTNYHNIKYKQVGRLFQGSYKGRRADDEGYLQYLDIYIQVLNPFEEYPGGVQKALKEFDKAFEFAIQNPFCSLGEIFGKRNLGIVEKDDLLVRGSLSEYKAACYEALVVHSSHELYGHALIDG